MTHQTEQPSEDVSSDPFEPVHEAQTGAYSADIEPTAEQNREMAYRANLEVGPDADLNAIRASYRRLLRLYHPDLNASDSAKQRTAEQITQRLNEAWDYLQTKLSDKSREK